MNNFTKILIASLAVLLLAGGAFMLMSNGEDVDDTEPTANNQVDNQSTQQTQQTTESTPPPESASGSFVTLSEYEQNREVHGDNKKVYFFHASWCPICQSIEEDLVSDPTQIPPGTTIIKVDFDSNVALRQQYGVTTQYTFVQFDNDGNQISKWSATNVERMLAGIS